MVSFNQVVWNPFSSNCIDSVIYLGCRVQACKMNVLVIWGFVVLICCLFVDLVMCMCVHCVRIAC